MNNEAARALRIYMAHLSEEGWCAGWVSHLEFTLWEQLLKWRAGIELSSDEESDGSHWAKDAQALSWLAEQAGGWWQWPKNGQGRELSGPFFVVATQTLEVGANLDFDVLVTECASLDALRQRFGRLNRMGRPIEVRAAVLVRADQTEKSDDDPVYDTALAATWKWLKEHAGDTDIFDFGISALAPRLDGADLPSLNAPTSHAPVMLPAHVDALVQTAPEPWPTPEVALFLHGPKSSAADVQVCWRADLTGNDEDAWKEAVTICPPAAPECLPVPIGLMRRWLEGAVDTAGPDVEGATEVEEPPARRDKGQVDEINRYVIRWRGRDEVEVVRQPNLIRPGDVVVIPASLQGWDVLAALGTDNPVADWGDRAYLRARGKAVLRLHPEVLKQWPQSEPISRLAELATNAKNRMDERPRRTVGRPASCARCGGRSA